MRRSVLSRRTRNRIQHPSLRRKPVCSYLIFSSLQVSNDCLIVSAAARKSAAHSKAGGKQKGGSVGVGGGEDDEDEEGLHGDTTALQRLAEHEQDQLYHELVCCCD